VFAREYGVSKVSVGKIPREMKSNIKVRGWFRKNNYKKLINVWKAIPLWQS
jgi:hypothetical protein